MLYSSVYYNNLSSLYKNYDEIKKEKQLKKHKETCAKNRKKRKNKEK